MWNTILGAVALSTLGFEIKANKEAVNARTGNKDELEIEMPCFNEQEVPKRQFKPGNNQKKRPLLKNKPNKVIQKPDEQPEDISPLAAWIISHDELLINILETGKHIITNDELEGVDIDELSDFIFSQKGVESVERVKEGLEITSR